jgi:hypothetical protein
MSVALYGLRQYRRMAAVLFATQPKAADQPLTVDALAEIFAIASHANHAAFRATYAERATGYLARMGEASGPTTKEALIAALTAPVVELDPGLARSDAELLLYNTVDNDGGEHLAITERLAVERVVDLVIAACDRLIRTGQRTPERFRLIDGDAPGTSLLGLQDLS